MDCRKVGSLIRLLRTEKEITQLELAQQLDVSDRAVSKWERGEGCPDITLVTRLAAVLGVSTESILDGSLNENSADGGNMKRIKFYVCPECGNIVTATGSADITCCGRKLEALPAKPADDVHRLTVAEADDEYYVTFSHEMTKSHYLGFIAYVACDRVCLVRLYPEQGGELHFPKMRGGRFFTCCIRDGLFLQ